MFVLATYAESTPTLLHHLIPVEHEKGVLKRTEVLRLLRKYRDRQQTKDFRDSEGNLKDGTLSHYLAKFPPPPQKKTA